MVRGISYDENEYQNRVELYKRHRPISVSEWADLADKYLENFPDQSRDSLALSRTLAALRGMKPTMGSTHPSCYVEQELYNDMKGLCRGGLTGSILG